MQIIINPMELSHIDKEKGSIARPWDNWTGQDNVGPSVDEKDENDLQLVAGWLVILGGIRWRWW